MLLGLSIRDVVLIDRLDISFSSGLTVLTGETGAGKSILLDSLGLALGARAEGGLLRPGAEQLSVTAEFAPPSGHPSWVILAEQGLEALDTLLLRRVVGADGRSRAFVNDQPSSVGLLRRLGESLAEIHGQFASHSLLEPVNHRDVLDAFAGIDGAAARQAWRDWRDATARRIEAEEVLAKAQSEEGFLRHAVNELTALAPRAGEEAELAERRAFLMAGEKIAEGIGAALAALNARVDVEASLRAGQRALERIGEAAQGRLDAAVAALDRAAADAEQDPRVVESVEARLFELRALARKHRVTVDALPDLGQRLRNELTALDAGGEGVARLAAAEARAREAYVHAAEQTHRRRLEAARRLDAAVAAELPPLRLEKARFVTAIEELPEGQWGESGHDRITFTVATNPGAAPGHLARIASGGELARFMLALKVVLAASASTGTIVFDEVDSGIGGATAAAVGDRLARLAEAVQVLVVTHSPQVAARGRHHWLVSKSETNGAARVTAALLADDERREEIARMLAGARITDEARAAAESLMQGNAG